MNISIIHSNSNSEISNNTFNSWDFKEYIIHRNVKSNKLSRKGDIPFIDCSFEIK